MTIELLSSLSTWIALGFLGSVLVLFLLFGIFILNRYSIGLCLKTAARKFFSPALLVCFSLFFLHRYTVEFPLQKAETLLSGPEATVYVDGKKKNISMHMLNSFRERSYIKRSGSQPARYFFITIKREDQSLEFRLGKDSRDENLYWVYFPEYKWYSSLCYLRIDSRLLNHG